MPLTHEDFIGNDGGEETIKMLHTAISPNAHGSLQSNVIVLFIFCLDEAEFRLQEDSETFEDRSFSEDPFIQSTPAPASLSLTEEQQQRIERNKQLALERRLTRQKQLGDYLIHMCYNTASLNCI